MDLKFKDNSKLKLAKFIQLEYIESTGTQYIDTCIKPNNNTRVVLDCMLLTSSGEGYLFGARDDWKLNWFGIEACKNTNSYYGNTYGSISISRNIRHLIDCDKNIVKVDNTTIKTWNSQTWQATLSSLMINTLSSSGGELDLKRGTNRFYNIKIYDNTTLILDIIPCITNLGTPGMYDLVSDTFFYNQGTGDFVAGPVVKSGLQETISLKTTTLYHENTPNIDGLVLLNDIINAQEAADDVVLNRIRVDIGNVSGSLSELLQYAFLKGFNDNYEPQTKPRLVGTWTINDWYTQEQLAAAQSAFDGLTIVPDTNYLINFDNLAVQVLDDTQPNYNPAAAIILQNAGLGNTLFSAPVSGQTGRWFMSKTQAAAITSKNLFNNRNTVTDSNGIVTSDTSATYTFTKFHEFRYFTGLTVLGGGTHTGDQFYSCYSLQYFTIPQTITRLNSFSRSKVGNCVIYLKEISISSISVGYDNCFASTGGGGNSDKFIISAYKDKYKDYGVLESYPYRDGRFKTWYQYACPQISYNGTDVTITVERTSTIYYTTDGSTPTEQSTEYTQPFAWNGQGVIKAIAIDFSGNSHADDRIAYADDFYATTVELPIISYSTTTKQITLSSNTPNIAIHYTLDGTHPTLNSLIYSGPIDATELGDIVKVRCFAIKDGMNNSEVIGKVCIMNDNLWGTDADTSSFAVQCLDSTKPNYNVGQSLLIDKQNALSVRLPNTGGALLKTDITNITSAAFFRSGYSIVDSTNLLDGGTYNYDSINVFKLCTHLTSIGRDSFMVGSYGYTRFTDDFVIPEGITRIEFRGIYCINNDGYSYVFPSTITYIGDAAFGSAPGGRPCYAALIRIKANIPPTLDISNTDLSRNPKVYVGDGSSSTHDDAILQAYLADTNWNKYFGSVLDTWYNYLHPQS